MTITGKMLEDFALWLRNEERSAATLEKYLRDVGFFAKFLSDKELSRTAASEWKESLIMSDLSPTSVNGKISSLNAFFRFLGREDLRIRTLRVQRKIFRQSDRELTRAEYEKLVNTARSLGKERLALILETICSTGIRVSELRYITIGAAKRGQATINQKGKCRVILMPEKLRKKLVRYAEKENISTGEIFITKNGKSMSRFQIWGEMKKLCDVAKIERSKVFPHNLRHLFATEFYNKYMDIAKLADILGHSSLTTTRIYLISTGVEHLKQIEELRLIS